MAKETSFMPLKNIFGKVLFDWQKRVDKFVFDKVLFDIFAFSSFIDKCLLCYLKWRHDSRRKDTLHNRKIATQKNFQVIEC